VVVCRRGINTLVTGRGDGDISAFCQTLTGTLSPVPVGAASGSGA
jgi:hypothetical protein